MSFGFEPKESSSLGRKSGIQISPSRYFVSKRVGESNDDDYSDTRKNAAKKETNVLGL